MHIRKPIYLAGISLMVLTMLSITCRNDRSKAHYALTVKVCDKPLYVEMFTVFGSGAFGSDIMGQYLTDSSHFRMFVGTFDNGDEYYAYRCKGDSVIITKTKESPVGNKVLQIRAYNLLDLKRHGLFE
ncbi:hypothetical protein [Chitinophaga nivalis]|uniref:DUF4369 domain-containing protein n=1 Tax=Chitinophaga nivalis TaxID=2991709 RepID=A0ABT3IKJ2_9BACT|nr:hypothetical protein [Chitinophaga nivalis]MCW3465856.1 hypothetical protein [Chitinophaga nivalis]MCW3484453.1 hypothetical protein [Chitinophaga nivalis]